MIKLILSNYPDPHTVKDKIAKTLNIETLVYMPSIRTEITSNGKRDNKEHTETCWDVHVYVQEGRFTVRIPVLSREVTTVDMLYEMLKAENGTADEWVRNLLGDVDADGLWDRYHKEFPLPKKK